MKGKLTEFPGGADRADGLQIASWRELNRLVLVGLPRRLKSVCFKDSVRGCSWSQAAFRTESRSPVPSQRTIRGAFQGAAAL